MDYGTFECAHFLLVTRCCALSPDSSSKACIPFRIFSALTIMSMTFAVDKGVHGVDLNSSLDYGLASRQSVEETAAITTFVAE